MDVIRTETFALEAHAQLLFFKACAFWRYACTICTMQAHPQLCLPTMMKIIGQQRSDFRRSRVLSIMSAYRGLGRTPQGSNDMHSCWLTSHLFLCARLSTRLIHCIGYCKKSTMAWGDGMAHCHEHICARPWKAMHSSRT